MGIPVYSRPKSIVGHVNLFTNLAHLNMHAVFLFAWTQYVKKGAKMTKKSAVWWEIDWIYKQSVASWRKKELFSD